MKCRLREVEGRGVRGSSRLGMTIIECVVALALVVVAAAIMTSAVQDGLAAQEDALALTRAGSAAESRVAEYLSKPYAQLVDADISENAGALLTAQGGAYSSGYGSLTRRTVVDAGSLTVPDFPGLLIPGYTIQVTVSDTFAGAERKLVTLQRFRPKTLEDEVLEANP